MCIHKVLSKSAKIRTFAKTRNNLYLCECDIRHGGGVARMRCWIIISQVDLFGPETFGGSFARCRGDHFVHLFLGINVERGLHLPLGPWAQRPIGLVRFIFPPESRVLKPGAKVEV